MSVESARQFLEKFGQDEQFRASIESASTDEAKQKIATDAGFEFTKEDLSVINQEEIEKLPDDFSMPQSSGTWVGVGVGSGAGVVGAGAGVVGAGAGITAAVTAGASASAAAV